MKTDYELIEAWQKYKDMSAREALVVKHSGLAGAAAIKHQTSSSHNTDDLRQEGILGILDAINTFDVSKGFRFSTYAMFYIRKYILRYIQRNHHAVDLFAKTVGIRRITSHLKELDLTSNKACEEFCAKYDVPMQDLLLYNECVAAFSLDEFDHDCLSNVLANDENNPEEVCITQDLLSRASVGITKKDEAMLGYRFLDVKDKPKYAAQEQTDIRVIKYESDKVFRKILGFIE